MEKCETIADLIPDNGLVALDGGIPNKANYQKLLSFSNGDAFSSTIDPINAKCCLSALWLFNNFLDESHTISQNIHEPVGSYLHGIMHRREGDFSNAKYWFNRAGTIEATSAVSELISKSKGLTQEFPDGKPFSPLKFVDRVEAHLSSKSRSDIDEQSKMRLEKISFCELLSVFDWCFTGVRSS